MKKSFLSVLIISLILLLTFPIPAFAAETGDVTPSYEKFEKTYVLDDLKSAGMDIDEYISRNNDDINLISFQEFAYSYYSSNMSDFGLYVYIYNPSGKAILTDSKSSITIAVSYDDDGKPNDYEKFSLIVCSRSTGEYSNLFYKFRVVDHISAEGSTIKQRVSKTSSERRYDVSEFELDFNNNTIEAYGVGGTFKFSGYAAGYGKDNETDTSTLNCEVTELETVTLDVHPTFYRTGVYDPGTAHPDDNHQYQINSVYFSIDNDLLRDYGNLQKIKAEWFEYKTNPIYVTDNKEMYDSLKQWIGSNIGNYNKNVDYSFMFGTASRPGATFGLYGYNIQTNSEGGEIDISAVTNRINQLDWLFYTKNIEDPVSSEKLLEYYKSYKGNGSFIDGTLYPSELFNTSVDEGRTAGHNVVDIDSDSLFNLIGYDETHNWWDKFVDFGIFIPETSESYKNVKPIEQITLDMIDDPASVLVDESMIDELRNYVIDENLKNRSVFIFRFAVTDYYTFESNYLRDNVNDKLISDSSLYFAEETAFLDFDIIQLTFNKEGSFTVIPVVADPITIIGGITAPPENKLDEFADSALEWLTKLWEKLNELLGPFSENWYKYILLAVGVILGVVIIVYTFPYLIKWLFRILGAIIKFPFELIEKNYKKKR